MGGSLLNTIKLDQLKARKNKDRVKTSILTTLIGEAEAIGKNDGNRSTTTKETVKVIEKFNKNLLFVIENSVVGSEAHGLALIEMEILKEYLPPLLTGAELESTVASLLEGVSSDGFKIGQVMGLLKSMCPDKIFDGREASRVIKDALAKADSNE